jgi:3D (Asp-Asp-Asp) domain-containing protein
MITFIPQNISRAKKHRIFTVYLLVSLLSWTVPQHSFSATGETSMLFPTDTAQQASVLFMNPALRDEYAPSKRTMHIMVTSYNSVPEQTDSTPFTTAMGTRTRDGVVATNILPFRTKVRFPDLYGSKVFVVEDRMNARYTNHIDIWSDNVQFSKQFGARYLKMEVL